MGELTDDVVEEALRLTRLAERAVDQDEAEAYRTSRDAALADEGYLARVRHDDPPVLVCYPVDWVVEGVVQPTELDDLGRAVERPLVAGESADDWAAVEAYNRALAEAVEADHGPVHGATASAFADFMGNHYARRIETAGSRHCREFLEDYFPRNAWPTDEQRAVAPESLRLTLEAADAELPSSLERPGR